VTECEQDDGMETMDQEVSIASSLIVRKDDLGSYDGINRVDGQMAMVEVPNLNLH
jgi:hypothetical protein